MPRRIDVSIPPERTDELLSAVKDLPGVLGLRLQRSISLSPAGDVVTVETTTSSMLEVIRVMEERGMVRDPDISITVTRPQTVISTTAAPQVPYEVSEVTWEEMESEIARESNMTINALLIMAIAGVLAAIGLSTNVLHYVIAAMLIAPGFEPLVRIGIGVVARGAAWRRGLQSLLAGYAALSVAAGITAWLLRAFGIMPLGSQATYLPAFELLNYWTNLTPSSVTVSVVASIAGALLIITDRTVLTAGVMVALALIPGAALIGMGVATADWLLAWRGLMRWGVDALIVVGASIPVLYWKQVSHQRRRMLS